jgi:DNA-binding Lrp family transcriptional regulator
MDLGMDQEGGARQEAALDDTDRAIVSLLVDDARLSVRAIARAIGMSPNAVTERIERLQRRGVIASYGAQVDPRALGYGMTVIVGLETLHGPQLDETFEDLLGIPEVESAHLVTGRWDLVVELRVRDHADLERVLLERIWRLRGFRHSETMICLRSQSRNEGWIPPDLRGTSNREG